MTISAASTRIVVDLPSGATNTTFPFNYLNPEYINVYYDGILKAYNTDYAISGQTVTFTPALTSDTEVSIISAEPYGNPYDLLTPEQWSAAVVNEKVNRLALLISQVRDASISVGPFDPSISISDLLEDLEQAVFDASASAISAAASASDAADSATLAQAWAESPTAVITGHYSAKWWAEAAQSMVIPNDSITTAMLQDGCVTTPKIADDSVTTSKINDGDVTFAKLGNDVFKVITDSHYTGMGFRVSSNQYIMLIKGWVDFTVVGGLTPKTINITGHGFISGTGTALTGDGNLVGASENDGEFGTVSISSDPVGFIVNPIFPAAVGPNATAYYSVILIGQFS